MASKKLQAAYDKMLTRWKMESRSLLTDDILSAMRAHLDRMEGVRMKQNSNLHYAVEAADLEPEKYRELLPFCKRPGRGAKKK